MKVRVCYTEDIEDDYRMALRHQFGEHGTLATRKEVRQHLMLVGSANDADIMYEWEHCDEGCQPEEA